MEISIDELIKIGIGIGIGIGIAFIVCITIKISKKNIKQIMKNSSGSTQAGRDYNAPKN